ncbi:MAG: hypothetical protein ABI351_07170 [Herbaspirillum sp.]
MQDDLSIAETGMLLPEYITMDKLFKYFSASVRRATLVPATDSSN